MPNKAMVDLNGMDVAGLLEALAASKDEAFKLRFRNATGQLDNAAQLQKAKKQIARINTVLRQREIAAAEKGTK
jgi:large subunit ribosomal protein L29